MRRHLIRLRARPDTLYLSRGRTVLATDTAGNICENGEFGLFVHETRLLSRHRLLIDGVSPYPVALSNVQQSSWLGYYIALPREFEPYEIDHGSGRVTGASQQTLEVRVSRVVGEGLHEDLDLTNFTQKRIAFNLDLEFDADFVDQSMAGRDAEPRGRITFAAGEMDDGAELEFSYVDEHRFAATGLQSRPTEEQSTARVNRAAIIRIEHADSQPSIDGGRVRFSISLDPQATWHACVRVVPRFDGNVMETPAPCHALWREASSVPGATRFSGAGTHTLTDTVVRALEQATSDLDALRLHDLDHGPDAWTMAAGLPLYVALFGRDTLTAGWQAAMAGPEMMRGALIELARWQGRTVDEWRDEQPGRMLHEAHTGPLEALNLNPRARSYSSITTSAFFPVILAELWHWTGDTERVRRLMPSALEALAWLDRYCEADGFYQYQTRSAQGVKHQAWKDSGDAIVDGDGRQVEPPIATCEEQAFAYAANFLLSEVLWSLGERDDAKRRFRKARELKARFNDAFWMDDTGFLALGLDASGRQIRSIASNPGHCLAAGIVDATLAGRTADRLLRDDLFNGWGIRTLSARNAAYNPFSYHRGSVWPVEQGTFVLGFVRYGLHAHAERLARATFEAAALFDFCRLPELFSGHQRDEAHPFPALYPQANSPQAWSASAVLIVVQSMLGLYPYAPQHLLLVDPHLPEWLPELTVSNLRVGNARVDLRFFREANGSTDYRVLDVRGKLHVVRQPSPWSLTAGVGERVVDLLTSLVPGR
jgi:glycogen debranching enzyme